MRETTDAAFEAAAGRLELPSAAGCLRTLNIHRPMPGQTLLRQAAAALAGGHTVEVESAPAPLQRLLKRLGARALVFEPGVHAYELAALWELSGARAEELEELLRRRGVRRIRFEREVESHLAAACAALELALDEKETGKKDLLVRIALVNARRAKREPIYRGREAGFLARTRT